MDLPNQLNAAGKSATEKLLGRLLATGIAEIDDIIGGSQRWELCDIAASTGSACSSEHQDPSYVLGTWLTTPFASTSVASIRRKKWNTGRR